MRPIDQVAKGSAQDEGETDTGESLMKAKLRRVGRNGDEGHTGNPDHDRGLVGEVGRVQQAKGGAGILHVRQIQKAGDELRRFAVERQGPAHDLLRQLIDDDDGGDDDELDRLRVGARLGRLRGRRRSTEGVRGSQDLVGARNVTHLGAHLGSLSGGAHLESSGDPSGGHRVHAALAQPKAVGGGRHGRYDPPASWALLASRGCTHR